MIVALLVLGSALRCFERVLLTEACRGKGITLFLSFHWLITCLVIFCDVLWCAWHVCVMYSRDEKVFIILALFTYDYENICMNRCLEYI